LRARKLIVLLCTLTGALLATAIVQTATPVYEASSSVYFALPSATSGNDLSQGSNYTQAQMLSYAALTDQPIVLQPVINELGLSVTPTDLAEQVSATASSDTVVIKLTAADPSSARAAAIANGVSRQLIATSSLLSPRRGADAAIKGTVVAVATQPRFPSSPKKKRDVAAGLLAGLIVGGLGALVRERTDTRLRTASDISALTKVPVVGEVVTSTALQQRGTEVAPAGREAESFRKIRTNLDFLTLAAPSKTLLITSALSGEGKSTTCVRLAASLAEAGLRVLLVDADLRRPSIAAYVGLEPSVGLTTALMGRALLEDLVQTTAHPSLHVLTSGAIPPNPAELLGSASMRQLLNAMGQRYDYVLLDSPPLLAVTDAAVLSKLVASTVLVASCSKLHRPELVEALATLERIDATVVGIVANQVSDDDAGTYEPYPSVVDGRRDAGARFTPARLLTRRSS